MIVAGAGTGKTATLVHRVAWLIAQGVEPGRILLLTFTRRAAAEMLHRADGLLRQLHHHGTTRVWGGTYHAIATRLLRRFGKAIGLPPEFTVHDRTDSEDLLNVVRSELNLAKTDKRFPKKGTCMSIYSRCVNARQKLEQVLAESFPWCNDWGDELERLFDAYVDRKEAASVLDYDDLLLYWDALLADAKAGPAVRKLFDCVLVDEYQDTNAAAGRHPLQALPGRQGRDRRRRRCPVDLRLPRRHGPQHPRFSEALSERHDRRAGAELPQHAADPGGHQPGDRPGQGTIHQEPLVAAQRRGTAAVGPLRRRRRSGRVRDPSHPRTSRGGRRPAPPGGAVPRLAPQHSAGGRTGPRGHSVSQVSAG